MAAYCVYMTALAAAVCFTRATAGRVVGALADGGVSVVVGVGVESFARAQG